jgi:hypothetical protein
MLAMYPSALAIHSVLRWAVLLTGLLAVARACAGWPGRRSWTPSDDRAGIWFVGALDLQFTVGLLLYVALSPLTQHATENMAATMQDPTLRYWAVEHPVGMVVALVLAHVGRVRIRKATTDDTRHRIAAVFFGIALLVILASTPWPGMPNARPLFPW